MNRYSMSRIFKTFTTMQSLSDPDRSRLDARVAETEKRTGTQIVLSVIERCDDYPELPWKGFALGAALAGLALLAMDIFRPIWVSQTTVLFAIIIILSAGAGFALLGVFVPGFARLFLDEERSETETRQYTESLFLSRELFATSKRTGILMLIGLFERKVIILPDTGLDNRINQTELQTIIDQTAHTLASGLIAKALEQGLDGLERALSDTKPLKPSKNELPDEIIEEKGS